MSCHGWRGPAACVFTGSQGAGAFPHMQWSPWGGSGRHAMTGLQDVKPRVAGTGAGVVGQHAFEPSNGAVMSCHSWQGLAGRGDTG